MRCKKCDEPVGFGPFRAESLKRFRQFVVLALVISLVALSLQLIGVPVWPVWLYGVCAFVLLQAILKWNDSRWVICKGCNGHYTHYGRDPGS